MSSPSSPALLIALLLVLPPGGAAAEPISQRSVADALAALKARDGNGAIVTESDGWTVINEPEAAAQWSFTPPGHPAHPAVVRRVIRRPAGGPPVVETEMLCEAAADACAELKQSFEAMNERISQALRARGRQSSTPPPAH